MYTKHKTHFVYEYKKSYKQKVKTEWVKTECTQTAYKTQIKNLYVKKRRTNLQILEYKKYFCNPPPPPLAQIFVHYTNTTQTGIAILSSQSSYNLLEIEGMDVKISSGNLCIAWLHVR